MNVCPKCDSPSIGGPCIVCSLEDIVMSDPDQKLPGKDLKWSVGMTTDMKFVTVRLSNGEHDVTLTISTGVARAMVHQMQSMIDFIEKVRRTDGTQKPAVQDKGQVGV